MSDGAPLSRSNIEVVFAVDAKMYDGRHANNGWLNPRTAVGSSSAPSSSHPNKGWLKPIGFKTRFQAIF